MGISCHVDHRVRKIEMSASFERPPAVENVIKHLRTVRGEYIIAESGPTGSGFQLEFVKRLCLHHCLLVRQNVDRMEPGAQADFREDSDSALKGYFPVGGRLRNIT